MPFDSTATEREFDQASQSFVKKLRTDVRDMEPDLSVDGLSDSILARIFRLLGIA